jgi:hypothetical protein
MEAQGSNTKMNDFRNEDEDMKSYEQIVEE